MPSGGHARTGPAPSPDSIRRDKYPISFRRLPAAGRTEPAPAWPLTRASNRERVLWEREWRRPQAVAWEELGLEQEVAMYVRTLAKAERPSGSVSLRTLLMRQMDALGITVAGMGHNHWIIDSTVEQPEATPASDVDRATAKARFRAIAGGAAG